MDKFIKKLKKGDDAAFEKLVSDFQQKVYSLAFGMCGNREDALDITQEVFVKVYRGISSFNGESSLSTWIYRITKNAGYDFLRKNKRNIDEEIPENFPDNTALTPEEIALKTEKIKTIREYLEKIPVKYKTALILREYENLPYSEIAEILDVSEGTVKSRIFRAREYLLKMILENDELF